MKTKEQVMKEFSFKGLTVTGWARARSSKPGTVRAVLDGKMKGTRGIGHKIAVELGLKEGEIVEDDGRSAR